MTKFAESAGFIKENMKLFSESETGNKYQVNQEAYKQFMKARGITEDTIKQVNEAQIEYNNGTVAALKDILIENGDIPRATINTRTASGVISTRMTREVQVRTPKTNELQPKYGVVSMKIDTKSRLDKELLKECSDAIQKAIG